MRLDNSERLFARARRLIPGGVNSPVRSFGAVGGTPPFIVSGSGAHVRDADGNEYLDFVGSWGPLILGHAHPAVVEAVQRAAADGTSFGAPTERELELAELITRVMPSIEMLRLVNSGTEAAMSAIRIARAYTGRSRLLKFNGNYHGHADGLLVKAGSGAATYGIPTSAGVPLGYAAETLVAEYNDLASVEALFEANVNQIAAVIVEPVAGNMGVAPPADGFLSGLRKLCDDSGALLIFDEVITGFRVAYGGAQERYRVRPDLTCLGKIIGGGLPVGAYGGRADVMQMVAPLGPAYQAGTLSGNPLATAAGIACLQELGKPGVYETLEALGAEAEAGLARCRRRCGCSGDGEPCRLCSHRILHRAARHDMGRGSVRRHGAVHRVLPRLAGTWGLRCAVAVRGSLRIAGAHAGGYRLRCGAGSGGDGIAVAGRMEL